MTERFKVADEIYDKREQTLKRLIEANVDNAYYLQFIARILISIEKLLIIKD